MAVPLAGLLVPAVIGIFIIIGLGGRVAEASAFIMAPVLVSGAVVIGEALAFAIIIIKIIIGSTRVRDTLALTINVIPDV